jgi:hypothetical protein
MNSTGASGSPEPLKRRFSSRTQILRGFRNCIKCVTFSFLDVRSRFPTLSQGVSEPSTKGRPSISSSNFDPFEPQRPGEIPARRSLRSGRRFGGEPQLSLLPFPVSAQACAPGEELRGKAGGLATRGDRLNNLRGEKRHAN